MVRIDRDFGTSPAPLSTTNLERLDAELGSELLKILVESRIFTPCHFCVIELYAGCLSEVPGRRVRDEWQVVSGKWSVLTSEKERSGGAIGEQDGDAVEDGVAAVAAGAADGGFVENQGLEADRANEAVKGFGRGGGLSRVAGHGPGTG